MSGVITQFSTSDLGPGIGGIGSAVIEDLQARVLREARKRAWEYYHANATRVLYTKKLLFWTLNIKIMDLKFIFIELFGADIT